MQGHDVGAEAIDQQQLVDQGDDGGADAVATNLVKICLHWLGQLMANCTDVL